VADGGHFEIITTPYLNETPDFDEIWCAEANSDQDGKSFY